MGFITKNYGLSLLGGTPPGTCPECATKHEPEQPHNQQSLTYQYKFYDRHGRWPTWADAIAHCAEDIKRLWRDELAEYGIPLEAEPVTNAVEAEIEIEIGLSEVPGENRTDKGD